MLYILLTAALLSASSSVTNVINNQVNSGSSTTRTEITTNVNGSETKVTSDQPGTIKVENINGEVAIESDKEYQMITPSNVPDVIPETSVIPSPITSIDSNKSETILNKIIQVFTGFWKNFSKFFVST